MKTIYFSQVHFYKVLLVCAILSPGSTEAAQKGGEPDRLPSIRTDVDLVLVPVTVMDRRGAMVTNLERKNFNLLQDNVVQNIVSFSQQNVPCSVGVIIDTSGSMQHQLNAAKSAVRAFLETAEPRDEASLMSVSSRPEIHSEFTDNAADLKYSLQAIRAGGSTALLDTLYLAMSKMRTAHNPRRAVLVVSDGMDNHSRYSKSELMRVAVEADVQVYTLTIGVPPRHLKPIQVSEEHSGAVLLQDLAEKTGGLHFTVEFPNQVDQAARQIGLAIRNQYVLGYRPLDGGPSGKWHKIQVKLDVPKASVYARNGYYSR